MCIAFALLGVSGLTFWFLVGFPFANHNESYLWVAAIRDTHGAALFTSSLELSRTYRPLGQLTAIGLYLISGQHLAAVQIANFVVTAGSLGWVICISEHKCSAGVLSMFVGGACFAGFIFLFHLHGIFYGPVVALIALLLTLFVPSNLNDVSKDALAGAGAFVVFLFHPYALLVFAAMYGGYWIERISRGRGSTQRSAVGIALALFGGSAIALTVGRPAGHQIWSGDNVLGVVASFAAVEVHWAVSALACVLTLLTSLATARSTRARSGAAVVGLGVCATFYWAALPVLILWPVSSIVKMLVERRWVVAALGAVTLILPAVSPTGSPTYVVFALVAAAVAGSCGSPIGPSSRCTIAYGPVALLYAAIVALVLLLRCGAPVPVLSRLATPLLAERERTFQLEDIVRWWAGSGYRSLRLTFERDASDPANMRGADQVLTRSSRPPTYQAYLDAYTRQSAAAIDRNAPVLVVAFGGGHAARSAVYSVSAPHAGIASVRLERPLVR